MNDLTPWKGFQAAVAGGNEGEIRRSFEELYKQTRSEMVRFAIWCVRKHNPDSIPGHVLNAEEVVQDAFTELYLKKDKIDKDPRRWILSTIRNIVRYRVSRVWQENKKKRLAQRKLDAERDPRPIECSLPSARRLALRKAVCSLPSRMKRVIVALVYRGESVATAAKKLGISENAVIQARRRALKKLEALLAN